MNFIPKYNVGDLILHKYKRDNNIIKTIGWIEKCSISTVNSIHELAYEVHWSDQDSNVLITERDIHILRQQYLEERQDVYFSR